MNWKDKTIFIGDNLHVMRGMNSDSVDLIYLDPPFNSNRNYAAPIGSQAAGAAFKDTWTLNDIDIAEHGELAEGAPSLHTVIQAARETHGKGMQSYLIMMSTRLSVSPWSRHGRSIGENPDSDGFASLVSPLVSERTVPMESGERTRFYRGNNYEQS